jgi:diguanylate cyclase (GGDEF)-like protein
MAQQLSQEVVRLLLVDPVAGNVARLRIHLADEELRSIVVHAAEVETGLERLRQESFDAILLDPDLLDCAWNKGILRFQEAAIGVPIILLTEVGNRHEAQRALAAGAKDHLPRGLADGDAVRRAIRYVCEQRGLRQRLHITQEKLATLSLVDPLTEIPNRRGIEHSLLRELKDCRRRGTDLLIILVGLDNLKRINGSLSHRVGDIVLRKAAERIGTALRDADEVGRVGDDLFLILLPRTRVAEGMAVAERIRLSIARDAIQVVGHTVQVTASLGLTAVSRQAMTVSEALAKAHMALRRSKAGGKNRVSSVLDVADQASAACAVSEQLVQSLLCEDVLQVASQPIVRLRDGAVISHELLIRGPAGPLHRPDELFRFSVEQDILTALDLRCLRKCVAAAQSGPHERHPAAILDLPGGVPPDYHINIMPSTLLETAPEELVTAMTDSSDRNGFCLEISEQQLLGDPSYLIPSVRALQQAGIRIAIDDVGFGHSCLEGLILLRPEIMKIDKRMVIGISRDRAQRALLQRLLRVASVLDTQVIAEGIENERDLRALCELGVTIGQGYYFGKPVIGGTAESRSFVPAEPEAPAPDPEAQEEVALESGNPEPAATEIESAEPQRLLA